MFVSDHAKQRYCERLLSITDQKSIRAKVDAEDAEITRAILDLWDGAKCIWKGLLGGTVPRHFYIKDNIILVIDTGETAVLTLYPTDYGQTDRINRIMTKELIHDLETLEGQLERQCSKRDKEVVRTNTRLSHIDSEIAVLEAKLAAKQSERATLMDKLATNELVISVVRKQIEDAATKLCKSTWYQIDVSIINGNARVK